MALILKFYISMFILNSIGIFVKLIQEYRGGAYIYSGGKGLAPKQQTH